MKLYEFNPPRIFTVGNKANIQLCDCGRLTLRPNEQVTFTTEIGGEFDVVRKDWGFYATPSLNGRLAVFGLRSVLVRNPQQHRYYILLVERGKEDIFYTYLDQESCEVVLWLDTTESLEFLSRSVL